MQLHGAPWTDSISVPGKLFLLPSFSPVGFLAPASTTHYAKTRAKLSCGFEIIGSKADFSRTR
jgi:hypothetical protein